MEYGEVGALYPSHHRWIKATKKDCHSTVFERLDGALPLLHLQRCICTWQPPILTALPSFPIKLVWTQATEARNYQLPPPVLHATPGLWVTISSGTLFWIMLFRILMPGIKGTVQLRFQTSFLAYILTPLPIQFAKGVELGWCRFKPTVLVFLGQQVLPETITGTNWISPDKESSYYNSSLLDQMKLIRLTQV